jgi:hypothetical protein
MKKLKSKVRDYRLGSIIVLCFVVNKEWKRIAYRLKEVDDYLLSINSHYTFEQLHNEKPLSNRLDVLTDFYRQAKK